MSLVIVLEELWGINVVIVVHHIHKIICVSHGIRDEIGVLQGADKISVLCKRVSALEIRFLFIPCIWVDTEVGERLSQF